jgi:hypothetical protein
MNMFRRWLMVCGLALFVVSTTEHSASGAVFRKLYPSKSVNSNNCQPSGGLFEKRSVSPTSSWSHRHPKWSSNRKATGAAFRP